MRALEAITPFGQGRNVAALGLWRGRHATVAQKEHWVMFSLHIFGSIYRHR
jgi:hypothetical protein